MFHLFRPQPPSQLMKDAFGLLERWCDTLRDALVSAVLKYSFYCMHCMRDIL
jgi:hypothetical protein